MTGIFILGMFISVILIFLAYICIILNINIKTASLKHIKPLPEYEEMDLLFSHDINEVRRYVIYK